MREMNVGQDRSFSEVDMVQRYNADLANDLGNALNRVTMMIGRYSDGILGSPAGAGGEPEEEISSLASRTAGSVRSSVEELAIHKALEEIMGLVRATNRYLETREPWQLAKDESNKDLLDATLYTAAEALRLAGVLLSPVMPQKMADLLGQLGSAPETGLNYETLTSWGVLEPGAGIPGGEVIFPRAELPEDLRD